MTTLTLHAQPYDTAATGFYFTSFEDYEHRFANRLSLHNVEEYEIQFIDGDDDQLALSKLVDLTQCSIQQYFDLVDQDITSDEMTALEYLVNNVGYTLADALEKRDEVEIYEGSLEDYAYDYAKDCIGLEGFALDYFDCEKFANDLKCGGDVVEIDHEIWVTNSNQF